MDSDFMSRPFYANGEIKSTLFRSPAHTGYAGMNFYATSLRLSAARARRWRYTQIRAATGKPPGSNRAATLKMQAAPRLDFGSIRAAASSQPPGSAEICAVPDKSTIGVSVR
jgi:hypothetical protein